MSGPSFSHRPLPYGAGSLSPRGELKDASLAARLRGYKVALARRQRLVRPEAIERELLQGRVAVTPKYDGQLWFFVRFDGRAALCAYDGRALEGTPLVDALDKRTAGCGDLLIAGELCVNPRAGGRARAHFLLDALADAGLEGDMRFEAFDLVEEDGFDWQREPWRDRHARLVALLDGAARFRAVQVDEVSGPGAVVARFHEWVGTGRVEGLVVYDEFDGAARIKPEVTLDAVIIGFSEILDGEDRHMSELVVALQRDEAHFQILGRVGKGFKEVERAVWFKRLIDGQVPSRHMIASGQGTLCRMVRPEIVVELTCVDLQTTDSRGAPIPSSVVRYDPARGYFTAEEMPLARVEGLSFSRERADKPADLASIGLDQIYALAPFPGLSEPVAGRALPESSVVARRVWLKTTSGRTSVRKALIIQTHKDRIDPSFPPYVLHFTDFSPQRADPLQTTVRPAATLDHALAGLEVWIEAKVKRGWTERV